MFASVIPVFVAMKQTRHDQHGSSVRVVLGGQNVPPPWSSLHLSPGPAPSGAKCIWKGISFSLQARQEPAPRPALLCLCADGDMHLGSLRTTRRPPGDPIPGMQGSAQAASHQAQGCAPARVQTDRGTVWGRQCRVPVPSVPTALLHRQHPPPVMRRFHGNLI